MSKTLVIADVQVTSKNLDLFYSIMEQADKVIAEESIDFVYFLGDTFHFKRSIDMVVFNSVFLRIWHLSKFAKVRLLVGNHDLSVNYDMNSLETFFPFAEVIDSPRVIEEGGVKFYCVPFTADQSLLKRWIVNSAKTREKERKKQLKAKCEKEDFAVLFFHSDYSGLRLDENGHSFDSVIIKDDYSFDSYNFAIGGHIHKPMKITDNSFYLGSPIEHDSSEAGTQKCFAVIDSDKKSYKLIPTKYPKHIVISDKEDYRKNKKNLDGYIKINIPENVTTKQAEWFKKIEEKIRKKARSVSVIRSQSAAMNNSREAIIDIVSCTLAYLKTKVKDEDELKKYADQLKRHIIDREEQSHHTIKIKRLAAENSLSYENMEINFDDISEEPIGIIGDNGSGKSSIIELICYALYGRFIRGSKIETIINRRKKKNSKVELEFSVNGLDHKIIRYRKHDDKGNSVIFDGNTGDSKIIQSDISLILPSFDTFKATVALDKATATFLEAYPSDRGKIVEEILGMSYLKEKGVSLNKKKKYALNAYKIFLPTINNLKEQASELRTEINKIKMNIKAKKKNSKAELKSLKMKIKEAENRLLDIGKEDSLEKELKALKTGLEKFEGAMEKLNNKLQKIIKVSGKKFSELAVKVSQAEGTKSKLERQLADVLDGKGTLTCDKCFSEYRPAKVRKLLEKKLEEVNSRRLKYQGEYRLIETRFSAKKKDLEDKLFKYSAKKKQAELRIRGIDQKIIQQESDKRSLEREILTLKKMKKNFNNSDEFLEKMLNEKISKLKEVKLKFEEAMEEKRKQNENIAGLTFWAEAFGKDGIRQVLTNTFVPIFEGCINKYLSIFNMSVSVKKKGKKKDLFIYIKDGSELVEYKAYSVGEKKRIDLAALLALNEITSAMTFDLDLMFMDEIMDGIDDRVAEGIVDVIRDFSKTFHRKVLAISHNKYIIDLFSDHWTVEKEKYSIIRSSVHEKEKRPKI